MNRNNYILLDECPVCRQGTLLAAKNIDTNNYLLICDDCLLQWSDPEAAKKGLAPLTKSKEANHISAVTRKESEKIGWDKYIERPFK